ncbi:MAG: HD domain-containing protein [Verrucomicrobia bacterium]|nr:HD domain-containing protein [Verrucomicrobiota bacterium]
MKIYDSVHGFIHFNDLESALIDTEVFQRLHYIHQLGISYMIYPGATHTRFEHSLGTMHIATQIFDQIGNDPYWRQIVRLAALCHDLGHLPFSHVAEGVLLGERGHEEWTLKIIQSPYLEPIWEMVKRVYPDQPVAHHIAKLAIGEEKFTETPFSSWEKIYSQIITGDFFGADRIDYLLRDAKATGLSYGLFDYAHLIQMLVVLPDGKLVIEENGRESCEALLLARHFMQRRVYQYPASKAYSFHLARFMKILYGDPKYTSTIENYISMSEPEIICALQSAKKNPSHPGHLDACALFDRKKRFRAISLPPQVALAKLIEFKERGRISDHKIHWDLESKHSLKNSPPIPILGAKELISIPSDDKNWLYLTPEFTFEL